jgi:hypothetical protein
LKLQFTLQRSKMLNAQSSFSLTVAACRVEPQPGVTLCPSVLTSVGRACDHDHTVPWFTPALLGMQSTVWGDSHMLPSRGVRVWVVYFTPKIERVISLLSASPVGEARCRCRKVWLTRIDYFISPLVHTNQGLSALPKDGCGILWRARQWHTAAGAPCCRLSEISSTASSSSTTGGPGSV